MLLDQVLAVGVVITSRYERARLDEVVVVGVLVVGVAHDLGGLDVPAEVARRAAGSACGPP